MTKNRPFKNVPSNPLIVAQTDRVFEDELIIDPRAILSKLWHGKWKILLCMIVTGALGMLYSASVEPRYMASAKVMVDSGNEAIVDVGQEVLGGTFDGSLQNEIEILQSTLLIGKVVDRLQLYRDMEFNPRLRPHEPTALERLITAPATPDQVETFALEIGLIEPPHIPSEPPTPQTVLPIERRMAISNVLTRLFLEPVEGSRVISIAYVSGDRQTAALVANAVAEQYIVNQLDAKLEATRAATEWIGGRVEELRARVQTAEEAVEAARADQSLEAGQSLEITVQQLQALNDALSDNRGQTRAARAVYQRLNSVLENGGDLGAVSEFRASPLIDDYRNQRIELLSQRASLDPDQPYVQRLDARLQELETLMRAEASRIVEAMRLEWLALQTQQEDLETDVREFETKALEQSREQVVIRQLEREAEASRVLYENFLTRMKETSEQEQLQTPDARILTMAEAPFRPLSGLQNRMLMLSLIFGAMIGVGLIFLLDKLNNTFRTVKEVETQTGLTVLGSLPALGRRMRRSTIVKQFKMNPKSHLAEAVRNLRTSILFSNVDNPPKVLMFTSSVPREGKSTTSVLVAMTSRQMGKSAVIVDCDLRLPSLAELLSAKDTKPGLLSLIDGAATLDEAIYNEETTGLDVLMTKPSEARLSINAADILSSKRFAEIIDELKERYDLVILDTPPALAVADPRIVAAHADAVVYNVRWDHTPRGAVLEGLKELRGVNAPLAGIVFGLVNEAKAARFAYSNSSSDGYAMDKRRFKNYYLS